MGVWINCIGFFIHPFRDKVRSEKVSSGTGGEKPEVKIWQIFRYHRKIRNSPRVFYPDGLVDLRQHRNPAGRYGSMGILPDNFYYF